MTDIIENEDAIENPDSIDIEEPDQLVEDNEPDATADDGDDSSDEERRIARRFGWKPKEEWKGDTTNYMPAGTYLERVVNPRIEKLPDLERSLEETRRGVVRFQQEFTQKTRADYEARLAALKAERDRAFDLGDKEKWQKLESEYEETLTKAPRPEPAHEPNPKQQALDNDPAFLKWLSRNQDWYQIDPNTRRAMATPAIQYGQHVAAEVARERGITDLMQLYPEDREKFYTEVERRVRSQFNINPPQQGKPSVPNPPASATATTATRTTRSGKKGWNDLPAEVRKEYPLQVKFGFFEDSDKGRNEYAKIYFEENPS
jgi:hypothetical protein